MCLNDFMAFINHYKPLLGWLVGQLAFESVGPSITKLFKGRFQIMFYGKLGVVRVLTSQ